MPTEGATGALAELPDDAVHVIYQHLCESGEAGYLCMTASTFARAWSAYREAVQKKLFGQCTRPGLSEFQKTQWWMSTLFGSHARIRFMLGVGSLRQRLCVEGHVASSRLTWNDLSEKGQRTFARGASEELFQQFAPFVEGHPAHVSRAVAASGRVELFKHDERGKGLEPEWGNRDTWGAHTTLSHCFGLAGGTLPGMIEWCVPFTKTPHNRGRPHSLACAPCASRVKENLLMPAATYGHPVVWEYCLRTAIQSNPLNETFRTTLVETMLRELILQNGCWHRVVLYNHAVSFLNLLLSAGFAARFWVGTPMELRRWRNAVAVVAIQAIFLNSTSAKTWEWLQKNMAGQGLHSIVVWLRNACNDTSPSVPCTINAPLVVLPFRALTSREMYCWARARIAPGGFLHGAWRNSLREGGEDDGLLKLASHLAAPVAAEMDVEVWSRADSAPSALGMLVLHKLLLDARHKYWTEVEVDIAADALADALDHPDTMILAAYACVPLLTNRYTAQIAHGALLSALSSADAWLVQRVLQIVSQALLVAGAGFGYRRLFEWALRPLTRDGAALPVCNNVLEPWSDGVDAAQSAHALLRLAVAGDDAHVVQETLKAFKRHSAASRSWAKVPLHAIARLASNSEVHNVLKPYLMHERRRFAASPLKGRDLGPLPAMAAEFGPEGVCLCKEAGLCRQPRAERDACCFDARSEAPDARMSFAANARRADEETIGLFQKAAKENYIQLTKMPRHLRVLDPPRSSSLRVLRRLLLSAQARSWSARNTAQ